MKGFLDSEPLRLTIGRPFKAGVAHLVERDLAKVEVDGSIPFTRSIFFIGLAGFLDLLSYYGSARRRLTGAWVGALILTACGGPAPPDPELLRNFEYASAYFPAGAVRLTDGAWSQPAAPGSSIAASVALVRQATGDVSGDGLPDAAVVLVSQPGGSGTFYDLHLLVTGPDGAPVPVPPVFLGDRLPVSALRIENQEVIVDIAVRDPDDPFAATSGIERRWYSFENGGLRLARRQPLKQPAHMPEPAEETDG